MADIAAPGPSRRQDGLASDYLARPDLSQGITPLQRGNIIAQDNANLWVGDSHVHHYAAQRQETAFSIASVSIDSNYSNLPALTTTVLSSVARAAAVLKTCQKHTARLKFVDLSVASMHADCLTLRMKLQQIKALICKPDTQLPLDARFEDFVLLEYGSALETCEYIMRALNKHLSNSGLTQLTGIGMEATKSRLQALSNHQSIEMISKSMRSSARAMDVLCSAFQAETTAITTQIMADPETQSIFESLLSDGASVHESFYTARSVTDDADNDHEVEPAAFGFDEVLRDTPVYRRAVLRNMARSKLLNTLNIHDDTSGSGLAQGVLNEGIDVPSSSYNVQPRFPLEEVESTSQTPTPRSLTPVALETHLDQGSRPKTLLPEAEVNKQLSENALAADHIPTQISTFPNPSDLTTRFQKLRIDENGTLSPRPVVDVTETAPHIPEQTRRNSISSESSEDTISGKELTTTSVSAPLPTPSPKPSPQALRQVQRGLDVVAQPKYQTDRSRSDDSTEPQKIDYSKRLPTLMEVLSRKTKYPYTLFDFYLYMRDIQRSVDYLDFWLDVSQHTSLCRHYVRELRNSVLLEEPESNELYTRYPQPYLSASIGPSDDDLSAFSSERILDSYDHDHMSTDGDSISSYYGDERNRGPPPTPSSGSHSISSINSNTIARSDLKASVEKILYTFILPSGERELVLPQQMVERIIHAIEVEGRDDPEIFDDSKEYVFQAMELDAFPQFLSLGRPLMRALEKSVIFRPLAMRLTRPSRRYYSVTSGQMKYT